VVAVADALLDPAMAIGWASGWTGTGWGGFIEQ
jgi:hypothetical protein